MIKQALFALMVAGLLRAQNQTPSPPSPPIQPVPRMVHFILSLPSANPNDSTKPPRTVEITRTDSIEKVDSTSNSGVKQTLWILGQTVYSRVDGKIFSDNFNAADYPPYLRPVRRSFYGVEWVNRDHYKGVMPYQGVSCFYYETSSPNGSETTATDNDASAAKAPKWKAWVNQQTSLPVAVQSPYSLTVYQFLPPPTEMLQPPADIVKQDQEDKAGLEERIRQSEVR